MLKPLIKYFSLNLIKQKIKSFLLKNFAQDSIKVLYPTKFKSFDNGVVKVELQGACSGCPSSIMTLKQGVQNLLKHYVKEVNSVEAI